MRKSAILLKVQITEIRSCNIIVQYFSFIIPRCESSTSVSSKKLDHLIPNSKPHDKVNWFRFGQKKQLCRLFRPVSWKEALSDQIISRVLRKSKSISKMLRCKDERYMPSSMKIYLSDFRGLLTCESGPLCFCHILFIDTAGATSRFKFSLT